MSISERDLKESDIELRRVLDEMLDGDETITARAAARKCKAIVHASTITRSSSRSELVASYKARQAERRQWVGRLRKDSRSKTAADMATRDAHVADLERQVEILKAFILAMIRAIGELGGMSKWLKFFDGYREVRDELKTLGVLPGAHVTVMEPTAVRERKVPRDQRGR